VLDVKSFHAFLRGEFEAEAVGGFARLRRIPDTHVRHFLDYYASLDAGRRDALADASTLWGALRLAGNYDKDAWDALNSLPARREWLNEMTMGVGRDPHFYYSVPILRTCVAQAKIDRMHGKPASVPADIEEYALSVKSVKAPELRKRVRAAMTALFGAKPSKGGGGDWDYEGSLSASQVMLGIDYGGRHAQLRYQVRVVSANPPVHMDRGGLEIALGAGLGHWNFIVEDNVDDAIALLAESVSYMSLLPRRLP